MTSSHQLNEKWLKASVLGTTWAASEIVFGSFLHNLRIPFSGNLLTAIGLILLISASYKWKESGLFWRAGIICALMKTISPSAVIFGPMVAIFMEAILLELSVFMLGRNMFGFLLGSILAMSWVLFQRIINLIIFYGENIVEIYTSLMEMAEKQLNIVTDLVWLPIILFLAIHAVFGLVAGFIGIRAGKSLVKGKQVIPAEENIFELKSKKADTTFKYSPWWLWLNLILIVSSLFLIKLSPIYVWVSVIILIVAVWSYRYKSALHQLLKPKFWLFFVFITMLSAFVFSSLQSEPDSLINGMITGIEMNFRAVIIIIGFSIMGKELYNPKIVSLFQKSSNQQLLLALELSFQSVPSVIAGLPNVKTFLRRPVVAIQYLIENADKQLITLRTMQKTKPQIFIVTGEKEQGKTNFIIELVSQLQESKFPIAGFYSKRIMNDQITVGYDVVDITSGKAYPFLRKEELSSFGTIGNFSILPEGFHKAVGLLSNLNNSTQKLVVIDEVGKLELNGKGWSESLDKLSKEQVHHLLISVRTDFLDEVIRRWNFSQSVIFDISKDNPQEAAKRTINLLQPQPPTV